MRKRIEPLKGKTRPKEMVERMRQTKRKLTDQQVRDIRESKEKGVALAAIYNVSTGLISKIRSNTASGYKHII